MTNKKLLIADDHSIVRAGLAMIIESNLDNLQIDNADNYEQTRELISHQKYDLLILDINIPGGIFKSMIKDLRILQEDLKILVFSTYNEEIGVQYIMEGANAFLSKTTPEEEIIHAISFLLNNNCYYTPQILSKIGNQIETINLINKLSERELEIFKLLAKGNGNIEISNILKLKMSTIGTHKKKIFDKLQIKTILELIRINDGLQF